MIKRIFALVTLVLLTATMALAEVKPGAVITESFAVRQIRPEEPWKVYINAQMAGGEMRAIVCKVSMPGGAVFPLAQTEINNAYRLQLSGYLSLPSEILNDLGPEELVLNVQIKDNAGRLNSSPPPPRFTCPISYLGSRSFTLTLPTVNAFQPSRSKPFKKPASLSSSATQCPTSCCGTKRPTHYGSLKL